VESFPDSQGKLEPRIHFSLEKACFLETEKVIGEAQGREGLAGVI
jgi:hypothetical protein